MTLKELLVKYENTTDPVNEAEIIEKWFVENDFEDLGLSMISRLSIKKIQKLQDNEQSRKETAREILNDLYFNLQSSVKGRIAKSNDYYNVMGWIEEIAQEFGVEVYE